MALSAPWIYQWPRVIVNYDETAKCSKRKSLLSVDGYQPVNSFEF